MRGAELCSDDVAFIEEIHRSSGGSVYAGRDRRTGAAVILKERLKPELGSGASLAHELDLYARLPRHPHIVECCGHFWKGSGADVTAGWASDGRRSRGGCVRGGARLVLVLEAAPLGDLHELVQSRRRLGGVPLAERFICSLFTQIASAVVHLHAHGVVHRDLKSLNVVLFAEADAVATARGILRREEDAMWQDVGSSGETYRSVPIGAIRAKICDLGVSRARSNDTVYLQTFCGTPAYLAPEIVGSRPYTEGADVWSLGVLLYELAALSLPFFGRSVREVSDLIARGKFAPLPPTYSAGLVGLVSAMLQLDLDRRPDAQRVLEWAKGLELDRAAQAAPSEAAPAPGDHSLGHGAPREDAKHRETAPPREGKFERYRREFEERQRCAAVERNATEGVTGGTADILVMEEAPRAEEAAREREACAEAPRAGRIALVMRQLPDAHLRGPRGWGRHEGGLGWPGTDSI
ncbi:hypothetical protein EMIHUDRAFT_250697 [Emiliania huxleyi CCMP1516]|uniref:non-specific serine/threonine protein kinase n=2 Tax=Emiliania huxleyi TaxID=2903 RepID=A0A0D3HYR0_EMIH1|nr:hypothetical protein EMIHUDRAFT_250697 [Emiliania huxleyi CCMP1516]EOD04145.1 hypothetical protein EMIHUDRAFT_250697 [Emiliania huxleyi CCMP1516]|eukprot:XP_005756574.1 hypothetical protein EMIHUDRAFT_250697 [Emiliania huxleyi CCMP1516]